MSRYRFALLAAVVVVAAAVTVSIVRHPAAPVAGGGVQPVSGHTAAPDFTGIDAWINTQPLTLQQLRGKVVLVDFWTFSCVNCVRTLPHLRELYDTYRSRGFVLVGVHSPEFDFEKVAANVAGAVRRLDVTWPVAVDSEMATWNAYGNNYWPAEYLIDRSGREAYTHFGEGDYAATDSAVASLLGLHASSAAPTDAPPPAMTPELYAGSQRGQLADGAAYGAEGEPQAYPDRGPPQSTDLIQVTGTWVDHGEYLQAAGPGHVRLRFQATEVFVVAGSAGGLLTASVRVDGAPPAAALAGPALASSALPVGRQDLFHVLTAESGGYHLIDLTVPAGFQLFTFTFG